MLTINEPVADEDCDLNVSYADTSTLTVLPRLRSRSKWLTSHRNRLESCILEDRDRTAIFELPLCEHGDGERSAPSE
jgi:hypothetical protein